MADIAEQQVQAGISDQCVDARLQSCLGALETGAATAEVLRPGMVLLRQVLPKSVQETLASAAFRRGENGETEGQGASGFKCWWVEEMSQHHQEGTQALDSAVTKRKLNVAKKNAGRIYDSVRSFPCGVTLELLACHLLDVARAADPALARIPRITPTHLQLWNYQPKKGVRIGWHRDDWWSDGEGDYPVLSLSVGASCMFLYKLEDHESAQSITLESGDALIFGGPCRYILHSVKRIHGTQSAPEWLQHPHPLCGGRLNFTFRYAPAAIGREAEYR